MEWGRSIELLFYLCRVKSLDFSHGIIPGWIRTFDIDFIGIV